MRILYIHSTSMPPLPDLRTDRFFLLSEELEGDVLHPIWFRTPEEVEEMFGPGSYPVYTVGRFRYHWILSPSEGIRGRLATFWFYIRKGIQLHKERRYECIVAYSHMTTGLMAGLVKLLTGTRLVIEIATSPNLVYITERPQPGLRERVMKAYSDVCLHLSLLLADRTHLLYAAALEPYPLLRGAKTSVFHEFVPVAVIDRPPAGEATEPYVLFVGAPWYLKGVDVLIRAFLKVAPRFPAVKLKLLGHFPDRADFEGLIEGSPMVEIMKARPNPEALEIIRRASVIVLPSRCEGMGRVLIEGMAAAIPLIGSDVGGIPTMIHPGENGFLIPVGDVNALAGRLAELLGDAELRHSMGERGFERAHHELNEKTYVEQFTRMVAATLQGGQ
jgi:glycosyltransferase involved in cell wall biosynthesis